MRVIPPPQDLIRRLLTVDPKRRLTAAQAVTHPWLLSKDADLLNHNLGVNLEQLKLFNARRKLRAAIKSVSAEHACVMSLSLSAFQGFFVAEASATFFWRCII